MTRQESETLQQLTLNFKTFLQQYQQDKKEDSEWKAQITERLNPLVEERLDRMILQKYGAKGLKILAFIVGLLASIGAAYRYLLMPLMHWK